jgi:signal transduction histidine kinase
LSCASFTPYLKTIILKLFDQPKAHSLTQNYFPFELLYLLSSAICLGLMATFVPPLGKRMLKLSGPYWLSALLAMSLYGILYLLSVWVSKGFATAADIVWSFIFISLPLNVRSWRRAVNLKMVIWSSWGLVVFTLGLEFVFPIGSELFPERVTLIGLFQLASVAWLSWEINRFNPRFKFSQLGLIQLLSFLHAISIIARVCYTLFVVQRPLVDDDLFMSYTLLVQGVLLMLSAMVFNNHYLESLLNIEADSADQIRLKESQLQVELQRTETLKLEQSRLLLILEHQLRNPMTVLQLALSDPSVAQEPAIRAARSLKEMQTLLERCVLMDKLVTQAIVVKPQWCDLEHLIEQICLNHPEGHRVSTQAHDIPMLQADLILLNVVLSNLIDNALKYSPPKEPVRIELTHQNHPIHQLQLSISNPVNPQGLPAPEKIFTKYNRSSYFQQMDGSGLGLYLSHKMVVLMQATIRYEPSPTQVRFVLCIPL